MERKSFNNNLVICKSRIATILDKMLEHGSQDIGLPSPSHLAMLVWKIQIKQHCKGKGVGRVGGVSTTFVNDCSSLSYIFFVSF